MCKYCFEEDSDVLSKCLVNKSLSFGVLGKMNFGVQIYPPTVNYKKPILCVNIGDEYDVDIPIKYCPMCGRKL